ncbi:hypothetical protein AB0O75_50735 [Streptomyces sp. NPDC088921]|uniref:hypothetical protein n=1 Tax=unclassified Streptomyces TaxID=2593676 RepID=UPI00343821D0
MFLRSRGVRDATNRHLTTRAPAGTGYHLRRLTPQPYLRRLTPPHPRSDTGRPTVAQPDH